MARDLIEQNGVTYRLGREEFMGKEGLVRHAAEEDTTLVRRVTLAAIEEGLVGWSGGQLSFGDRRFGSEDGLVEELIANDDLRLALYEEWVDHKVDPLSVKLFISLDLSTQTDELGRVERQLGVLLPALLRPRSARDSWGTRAN